MAGRAKSAPMVAVEGSVPAPRPLHRSPVLLAALGLSGAALVWVALLVAVGAAPLTIPVTVPAPWLFLFLVPSAAAILTALRGLAGWAVGLTVLSLGLVATGAATAVVVTVALITVWRARRQWAAHDLDTVLTTAAARGLPVLVVQHVAGPAKRRSAQSTTQIQVRDVDTGALATARVWGRVQVGTHLVRQGMNIIAQAPPGADAHLRRWVDRERRD